MVTFDFYNLFYSPVVVLKLKGRVRGIYKTLIKGQNLSNYVEKRLRAKRIYASTSPTASPYQLGRGSHEHLLWSC